MQFLTIIDKIRTEAITPKKIICIFEIMEKLLMIPDKSFYFSSSIPKNKPLIVLYFTKKTLLEEESKSPDIPFSEFA